jgi:hypothetical protein
MIGALWSMSHADLETEIRKLCKERGIKVWQDKDPRRNEKGFPDFLLLGSGNVLWRELKTMQDDLKPEQRRFGSWLMRSDQDWAVWRPSDLRNGSIETQLDRIAYP